MFCHITRVDRLTRRECERGRHKKKIYKKEWERRVRIYKRGIQVKGRGLSVGWEEGRLEPSEKGNGNSPYRRTRAAIKVTSVMGSSQPTKGFI